VKTGSDATRNQVSRTTRYTSVYYLDSLTPPGSFGSYAQNHRIRWPEFRTWQINNTTLAAIKLEDDGDLHLRLRSSTGKTMIAEIPRPGCISSSSLWKAGITAARNYVTGRYWFSLDRWHYLYKKIDNRGLGFFDEEHNMTGVAPASAPGSLLYVTSGRSAPRAYQSRGIAARHVWDGSRTLGRPPAATPHGGDGDECPGGEPDDQDGDVAPGVMAGGEPAHP
jgi:hypothetical protein